MPRAGVHARRDLPLVRATFRRLRLQPPAGLAAQLRQRHRRIDANQRLEDQELHFMRGPRAEDTAEARQEALDAARRSARRAADTLALVPAGDSPGAQAHRVEMAVGALAALCHIVRDSYSLGHTVRAPGPGGPFLLALRAWQEESKPGNAFGLRHALKHDIRFEVPFAWFAPEVPVSDVAVDLALRAVVDAVKAEEADRTRVLDQAWDVFEAACFARAAPGRTGPRPPGKAPTREGPALPPPTRSPGGREPRRGPAASDAARMRGAGPGQL